MGGIQPDVLTPEEWQGYLQKALVALRQNPQDEEALQAVRDANEALNSFEQPAIAAGENVGESGFGRLGPAVKGLGQAALDIPRGIAQTVLHPIQTLNALPELPQALLEGITSGDPGRISRTVGNIGTFALPFAKTSRAAAAPTVGAVAGRAVTAPFRAIGNLLERPALRNQVLAEQQALAAARRGAVEAGASRAQELFPSRLEQAGLRTDILRETAQRAPSQTEAALRRIELMEQQLERGGPTMENLMLRNELLKLKLDLSEGGGLPPELPPSGGAPVPTSPVTPTLPPGATGAAPFAPGNVGELTGLPREGISITGSRATPPIPTAPTILEMHQGISTPSKLAQARAAAAAEKAPLLEEPGRITPNNPLSQLDDLLAQAEPVENIPGAMGQKAVQFGEGSPLSPLAQSEIKSLLGQLQRILGQPK